MGIIMSMTEIRFHGPFTLLPHPEVAHLSTQLSANNSGLFLWTFDYKKAHRIHFVGHTEASVLKQNLSMAMATLALERPIYDPDELKAGSLKILVDGNDSIAARCDFAEAAINQLQQIRVFYAEDLLGGDMLSRVRDGILEKLLNFGDLPGAWLDPKLKSDWKPNLQASAGAEKSTIRFHRPAFIASLPDEMYV